MSLNTPTHSYPRTFALIVPCLKSLPSLIPLVHPLFSFRSSCQCPCLHNPNGYLPPYFLSPSWSPGLLHASHSVLYVFVCRLLPPLFKLHEGRLFALFPAVSPASRTVPGVSQVLNNSLLSKCVRGCINDAMDGWL